jgi:hypothetical protein
MVFAITLDGSTTGELGETGVCDDRSGRIVRLLPASEMDKAEVFEAPVIVATEMEEDDDEGERSLVVDE